MTMAIKNNRVGSGISTKPISHKQIQKVNQSKGNISSKSPSSSYVSPATSRFEDITKSNAVSPKLKLPNIPKSMASYSGNLFGTFVKSAAKSSGISVTKDLKNVINSGTGVTNVGQNLKNVTSAASGLSSPGKQILNLNIGNNTGSATTSSKSSFWQTIVTEIEKLISNL